MKKIALVFLVVFLALSCSGPQSNYMDDSNSMIFVAGGTFIIGSIDSVISSDQPVDTVTLSDYFIGKYEITHSDYIEFLNDEIDSSNGQYLNVKIIDIDDNDCAISYNGSFKFTANSIAKYKNCPIMEVTWYGAVHYCNWLSGKAELEEVYNIDSINVTADFSKNGYRLPTEAEWEYAARGGQEKDSINYTYSGSNICGDVAWYYDNSFILGSGNLNFGIHPVGKKHSNELGLYDMSGNVFEWCWDRYSVYENSSKIDPTGPATGAVRVLRGGSWSYGALFCGVSNRMSFKPSYSYNHVGFRIARNAQ